MVLQLEEVDTPLEAALVALGILDVGAGALDLDVGLLEVDLGRRCRHGGLGAIAQRPVAVLEV